MTTRQFLQTVVDARKSAQELLQLIFASELLMPSRCLWIVSPWLRDIPVLDNSTGSFLCLCPDFPRAEVRLSRVLRELVDRGTTVVIAARADAGNRQVLDGLQAVSRPEAVIFHERSELHAKGIVGDRYSLARRDHPDRGTLLHRRLAGARGRRHARVMNGPVLYTPSGPE